MGVVFPWWHPLVNVDDALHHLVARKLAVAIDMVNGLKIKKITKFPKEKWNGEVYLESSYPWTTWPVTCTRRPISG